MIIKHNSKSLSKVVDVMSIVGKKVYIKNGESIGSIKRVYIDPDKKTIEGVQIKRGIFENNDYIGKGYIKSFTQNGVMLSIDPLKEIIGMEVRDSGGKKVGKVKSFKRSKQTNTLLSLSVNRGYGNKDLIVPQSSIKDVGKKVVLKTRL